MQKRINSDTADQFIDVDGTIGGAIDSTGHFFALDSCQQTITKDGSGNITQIDAYDGTNTWRQTYTYGGATTITISQWVKQP